MKKLLIILLIIPVLSNGQTLQGYSGRYFKAIEYFNSPIYKLSGVDLDSANTVKRGFFTPYQYSRLNTAFNKVTSQWVTSSSNIYYLTGKVGIGWNSPSYQLHVKGDIDADSMFIGGARVYPGDPNRWTDFNHNIYTDWGFVGINTNIPKHWLEVAGGIKADSIFGKGLSFYDSTYNLNLKHNKAGALIIQGPSSEDYYMSFNTGSSRKTILIDEGEIGIKVGIGLGTPNYRLDVAGTVNATAIYKQGSPIKETQWTTSSGNIYFNTGNVGIGTTNPSAALTVDGNKILFNLSEETKHAFRIYDAANANPIFDISGNDDKLIEIDSAGVGYKVGIGKIPTAILDVNGGVKIANDADAASAVKVGTMRYRVSGNNSYFEMCMQTGASTYAWVVIKTNTW